MSKLFTQEEIEKSGRSEWQVLREVVPNIYFNLIKLNKSVYDVLNTDYQAGYVGTSGFYTAEFIHSFRSPRLKKCDPTNMSNVGQMLKRIGAL